MPAQTIGQRIAAQRKRLGLSQEMLGEKTGVSRQAISKWESDAAVPEIDKLIALSKLFHVSIGWLLGVEETPCPQEADFTEAQLKTIEELVKRCQLPAPPPAPKRWLIFCGLACVWLILLGFLILGQKINDLQSWDNSLHSDDWEIHRRLDSLEAALESGIQVIPEPLLSEYALEVSPLASVAGAEPAASVVFSAIPTQWQEGDSGLLSVRLGTDTTQYPCTWDGTYLTASIPLEVQNGYEYCFLLLHADKTQEQQPLSRARAENIRDSFQFSIQVSPSRIPGSFSYSEETLILEDYILSLSMPPLFQGDTTVRDTSWRNVELILFRDGAEVGRESLSQRLADDPAAPFCVQFPIAMLCARFENIPLPEEELQLKLRAELSNGLYEEILVSTWYPTPSGELKMQ